ncbi:MAG: phage Gp37/Gp68 family protein [Clostridiales bacterium]|nr:phage Gp37/Gp68 family protein [Clostridiales bacterium]
MVIWNVWHGCRKKSEGCANCYMFRRDSQVGVDSSIIKKTGSFYDLTKKKRDGSYKIKADDGDVYICMTSDFFIEEADEWRKEVWDMVRERQDLSFVIITKRIERFEVALPDDWGNGWENITICATAENQKRADERIPILLDLPIKHRHIIHEPMLEKIDISEYLKTGLIEKVICGGESGDNARECDYSWILNTRKQCEDNKVKFYFKQTGANFTKDNKHYSIKRADQLKQAKKANINLL